jgi:hypothetical protein
VFFGVMKTFKKKTCGDFDNDFIEDQPTKLIQVYQRIATSLTIYGVFEKNGFTPDPTKKPYRFMLNEGFLEI